MLARRAVLAFAAVAPLAAAISACGEKVYTDSDYRAAIRYLDALHDKADEPLRSEVARHRAIFEARFAALPSDRATRSAGIEAIRGELFAVERDLDARVHADLAGKALLVLQQGGYIGDFRDWGGEHQLLIRPDGMLKHFHRNIPTESSRLSVAGIVLRVDQEGRRLRLRGPALEDRSFTLDVAPRTVDGKRQLGLHGKVLVARG